MTASISIEGSLSVFHVCQKCTGPYNDPRILSCLHSFCTECLLTTEQEPSRDTIACPSCQQTTSLPKGGVNSLPRNLRLSNNQENTLKRVISSPSPSCSSCETSKAKYYCQECSDFLCEQCYAHHQGLRKTRNHTSVFLQEVHSEPLPSSTNPNRCPDHIQEEMTHYCQQCNVPVCLQCTDHSDHHLVKVNEEARKAKQNLWQYFTHQYETASQQLKKALISGKRLEGEIKDRKKITDTIIREVFASLQEQEEVLLAQTSELATAKEDRLSHQLEGIQHLLEAMTICQSIATTAIGEYSDVELLSVAHTVQTRASQLQEQFSQTPLELCESPTLSVKVDTDEMIASIKTLNSLAQPNRVVPADPVTTSIVLPPQNFFVKNKEFKCKVISRNIAREELSTGGAVLSGQLTPTVAGGGKSVQTKVTDCGDGTYLVSITPQQLGPHQFSVSIQGQPLHSSPFSCHVLPFRNWSDFKDPVQIITEINGPISIAFSANGDMFATTIAIKLFDVAAAESVYVYDSNGKQKTLATGSIPDRPGSQNLFTIERDPLTIAIMQEVHVYVAVYQGIYTFTTDGILIEHTEISPITAMCIGPDQKIYVSGYKDTYSKSHESSKMFVSQREHQVQVLNQNFTLAHTINTDHTCSCLCFDTVGNLHIGTSESCLHRKEGRITPIKGNSHSPGVFVYTPQGEYIRKYGETVLGSTGGIVVSPAGYSFVSDSNKNIVVIFDEYGNSLASFGRGQLKDPRGIAIAPDGSVWVADSGNNRLVKY